ncbi:MAG: integrase [Pseudomonadales bacterium]|jgi:integrase
MPSVKLCIKVAPFVLRRSESIRMAKPEHIDFDKKLWIPLAAPVIKLLELAVGQSEGEYLFNSSRPHRPLSVNTQNIALRSLGIDKNPQVFHGFRSSFATLSREHCRLPGDLIEWQLGYIESDQEQVAYDRSQRIEERREMMEKWSNYLAEFQHLK